MPQQGSLGGKRQARALTVVDVRNHGHVADVELLVHEDAKLLRRELGTSGESAVSRGEPARRKALPLHSDAQLRPEQPLNTSRSSQPPARAAPGHRRRRRRARARLFPAAAGPDASHLDHGCCFLLHGQRPASKKGERAERKEELRGESLGWLLGLGGGGVHCAGESHSEQRAQLGSGTA